MMTDMMTYMILQADKMTLLRSRVSKWEVGGDDLPLLMFAASFPHKVGRLVQHARLIQV